MVYCAPFLYGSMSAGHEYFLFDAVIIQFNTPALIENPIFDYLFMLLMPLTIFQFRALPSLAFYKFRFHVESARLKFNRF